MMAMMRYQRKEQATIEAWVLPQRTRLTIGDVTYEGEVGDYLVLSGNLLIMPKAGFEAQYEPIPFGIKPWNPNINILPPKDQIIK